MHDMPELTCRAGTSTTSARNTIQLYFAIKLKRIWPLHSGGIEIMTPIKKITFLSQLVLGISLIVGASAASAQKTCVFYDTPAGAGGAAIAPASLTRALDVSSVTVGRDWPIGFPIVANIVQVGPFALICNGPGTLLRQELTTTSTPLPLVVPQPTGPGVDALANGKVYQSGIPGIGVYVASVASAYGYQGTPYDAFVANGFTDWNTGQPSNSSFNPRIPFRIQIRLVKTGPVSPGVISGSNLPKVQFKLGGLKLFDIGFSGSVNVVSQTCTTGTEPVPLGDHAASIFTGPGTGSPLKDFAINLRNCPAFYGTATVGGQYANLPNTSVTPLADIGGITQNVIGAAFTPSADNVAAPGTLKLSSPTQGRNNARNIGIEIRARGDSTPVTFNQSTYIEMPLTSAPGNYSIPFSARYVQLEPGAVVPGQANGSVEYTMTYF